MASTMKNVLIWLVRKLHFLILIYVLVGWALPQKLLFAYLLFIPVMILQWLVNDGTCILTNIENYVRQKPAAKKVQQGQFLRGVVKKLIGVSPTDKALFWSIYALLGLFWIVALARYFWQ